MNGDNDLDKFVATNIPQMVEASTDADIMRFFVRVDRSGAYKPTTDIIPWLLPFAENPQDILIAGGGAEVTQNLEEKNLDDPEVLLDFLNTCLTNYPAKKYGLIMWDHGGAYNGFGGDEHKEKRTIDDLTIHGAIATALLLNGVDKFDFFGFDACLMADLGSIYYASLVSDYYVASMELEPGHGWDWTAFGKIIENPEISVPELAIEIIDKFVALADSWKTTQLSLIAIDLSLHSAFQGAFIQFAQYLESSIRTDENLLRLITRAKENSWVPLAFGNDAHRLVDLQFLINIKNSKNPDFTTYPSQLQTLVSNVIDALQAMTIHYNTDDVLKDTLGISVYWPQDPPIAAAYDTNDGPYDAWKNFLTAYHDAHIKLNPTINSLGIDTVETTTIGFYLVTASVSPISRASYADVTWGYAVSGKEYLLGRADAKPYNDWVNSKINGYALDKVLAYCKDSKDIRTCTPVYVQWKYGKATDSYYNSGQFEFWYYQEGTMFHRVSFVITYQKDGSIKEDYFMTDTSGLVSAFSPEVGDFFTPLFVDTDHKYYRSEDTFFIKESGVIPNPSVFKLSEWCSCQILFEIEAKDLNGKVTTAASRYSLPTCGPKSFKTPLPFGLKTEETTVASIGHYEVGEPHRQTPWYLNSSMVIGVSVGAVACALIIVAIVAGLVIVRLKVKKYQIVGNTLTETLT